MHIFNCKYTDLILKVANCVSVIHYKELANIDYFGNRATCCMFCAVDSVVLCCIVDE